MRDGEGALPFGDFKFRHGRVVDHRFDYVIEFACHVTFSRSLRTLYIRCIIVLLATLSLMNRCVIVVIVVQPLPIRSAFAVLSLRNRYEHSHAQIFISTTNISMPQRPHRQHSDLIDATRTSQRPQPLYSDYTADHYRSTALLFLQRFF